MPASKKTVLVTGCSSGGVGAAVAQAFSEKNYHVFASARTPSKIPSTLHDKTSITILELDVSSSASIAAAVEIVKKETDGSLHVLINNAGAGLNMPALDTSIGEARKLFDLNFFAALEMIQVFAPMLMKAGGCVVNNASVGGMRPLVFNSIYGASKAALIQTGEALRLEVAPLGIRVLTLVTGGVETNFIGNIDPVVLPEGSYYNGIKDAIEEQPEKIPFSVSPEAFAQEVVRKVESGASGKAWVGGGAWMARFMYWLMPEWVIDRMLLSMKAPFNDKLADERKKRA